MRIVHRDPTAAFATASVSGVLASLLVLMQSSCCGVCGDDAESKRNLGEECAENADCASGLFCSSGVCVSPAGQGNPGAVATPEAPAPVVQPVPAGVAATVTANGLSLGTHGCTFWDSTGAYNRQCTLTQNSDGTVALRAPGTSLNPDIGFSGTLTGGPEQYGFAGQIKSFDSCTGGFQTTLSRQGNKYEARYRTAGCSLTIHIRTELMGGGAPSPGGCNCAHGREYGPEPDINVANGGCERLGCAPDYSCNPSNGNCVCNCG